MYTPDHSATQIGCSYNPPAPFHAFPHCDYQRSVTLGTWSPQGRHLSTAAPPCREQDPLLSSGSSEHDGVQTVLLGGGCHVPTAAHVALEQWKRRCASPGRHRSGSWSLSRSRSRSRKGRSQEPVSREPRRRVQINASIHPACVRAAVPAEWDLHVMCNVCKVPHVGCGCSGHDSSKCRCPLLNYVVSPCVACGVPHRFQAKDAEDAKKVNVARWCRGAKQVHVPDADGTKRLGGFMCTKCKKFTRLRDARTGRMRMGGCADQGCRSYKAPLDAGGRAALPNEDMTAQPLGALRTGRGWNVDASVLQEPSLVALDMSAGGYWDVDSVVMTNATLQWALDSPRVESSGQEQLSALAVDPVGEFDDYFES